MVPGKKGSDIKTRGDNPRKYAHPSARPPSAARRHNTANWTMNNTFQYVPSRLTMHFISAVIQY